MAFIEPKTSTLAKIKVVGVGGGGQNAVDNMVKDGKVEGVEFIAMNTDLQALNNFTGQVRVQLGPSRTHGLGSGADPSVGKESAEESMDEIKSHLDGSDMIFVAAGLGGGTGTGAAPVVAQAAKDVGALTVGVVTKPFMFEGKRRMNQADQGIMELRKKVDALIVIPNEKILQVVDQDVPMIDAFKIADEVIGKAVEGISDLITSTGLINVDFADVKAIMKNAGSALMGVGQADGENRAEKAAIEAINSPLLEVDIKGSTGVLINIVGDSSLTMHEVNKAANIISEAAHEGANIIFGANIDPSVDGLRVTVIATGFDTEYSTMGMNLPKIDTDEIISRIDSRMDQSVNSSSDEIQITEEKFIPSELSDTGDFDIEKLREELTKEDPVEDSSPDTTDKNDNPKKSLDIKSDQSTEEKKNKKDETAGSFWSFIQSRRS
jgi:cell division protein FtsZ